MEIRLLVPSLGVVLGLLSGSSALAAGGNGKVTFNKDVAPIVFKHCAVCHRPGGKGPMSLLTYEKARPFGRKIQEKVVAREMPPWGADPGYRKLLNDPSLSQEEMDTVVAWVKGGVLEGNPKDLPPAPGTVEGWTIGQPDVIYPMPEPFRVPAQGVLDLQVFYVSPPFAEDRWIQRIEVVPGNRSVVHHSTVSLKAPGAEVKHNRANPLPGVIILPPEQNSEEWAEYKPAKIEIANKMNRVRAEDLPSWSPPGTAVFVPAGSRLMLQMHYVPNGTETTDLSKVGVVFAKTPPSHELVDVPIHNTVFVIPAGAKHFEVRASATLLKDCPHLERVPTHAPAGKDFRVPVDLPGRQNGNHHVGAQLRFLLAGALRVREAGRRAERNPRGLRRVLRQLGGESSEFRS